MKGTQIKVIAERTVTVKAGQAKLREAIKNELAKKGSRAGILIGQLAAERDTVVWNPVRLDEIANELRHLAFQIRNRAAIDATMGTLVREVDRQIASA